MPTHPRPKPHTVERRAHRRADAEDPRNRGHGMRWFSLLPFQGSASLHAWACTRSRVS